MIMQVGSKAEMSNVATEISDAVGIQHGRSTVGGETDVKNWLDGASTSLALRSPEDTVSFSDLSFRLISHVHVHSSSQRADSVVQG